MIEIYYFSKYISLVFLFSYIVNCVYFFFIDIIYSQKKSNKIKSQIANKMPEAEELYLTEEQTDLIKEAFESFDKGKIMQANKYKQF